MSSTFINELHFKRRFADLISQIVREVQLIISFSNMFFHVTDKCFSYFLSIRTVLWNRYKTTVEFMCCYRDGIFFFFLE